jgi:hypothetical protein
MPFRPMTEKEIEETNKLIQQIEKEINRLETNKAFLENRIKEGIWYSGGLSGHKGK